MRGQQKEMKEQTEKLRERFGPKLQEELQKSIQHEMEQLRLQMRGDSFDI